MKANFKKNLKFCKKAVLYTSAPDQFGNHDIVFAAKEQADLEAIVEEISGTVNQGSIKQLTGGFWLGEVLPKIPEASDTYDILEIEFAPEDIVDCGGMANPVLASLAMLAASYLAECETVHKAVKKSLPTYDECTPEEFLGIFDELHEVLAYPPDRDVGLMAAADLMQLCKGAPFENSAIPSMCRAANKGHPRREELLGLYKNLVHSIVEQKTSLAKGLQSQIDKISKYEYRLARYTRKVTGNTFKLPKEIAEDICLNLDELQYLELRGNCVIMRTKTKKEEQEDCYHEADNAVVVEAPEECTTIVEIPSEMAKKAGIKDRVEIYSLKDRIEIYALE